jgi:hypothetical protein
MTCIPFGSVGEGVIGFICVNDQIRFHVGNRYIWMDWHDYTGPSFYTKKDGREVWYDPVDENDPVWVPFGVWLEKRNAMKAKRANV